jgi:opacity protein-like surface antigen
MKFNTTALLFFIFSSTIYCQGRWGVGAYGGVFLPITEFSDYYNTGFGGNVQVTYNWSENTLLTFSIGTSSWDFDNDAFNKELQKTAPEIRVDLDASFTVVPYLLGVRWYLMNGKYRTYILLEGGLYYYETRYQGTIEDSNEKPPEIEEIPETIITGNQPALALGIGTFIEVSDHIFLDVVLKYNAITNAKAISDWEDDQTLTGLSRTVQYITLLAGINYRF